MGSSDAGATAGVEGRSERATSRWARGAAIAAVLIYAALALWTYRIVLGAPSSTVPLTAGLTPRDFGILSTDQDLVTFIVSRAADHFLTSPAKLFEAGQCFPTAQAVTLGEHMFGDGLLGAPAWALTGDPVLTMNAVVVLTAFIGALAAYALVFYLTGSTAAAFVAGLLYGFHPLRVQDTVHPYIIANHWTVLSVLFADRLFQRRRWIDAALLGLCLSLQLLESFYAVLGLVLIGGVYGLHLVIAHRKRLPPPAMILTPLALAAVTAWVVYAPYLETRRTWGGALGGRTVVLNDAGAYAVGGRSYPGTVLLVLAAIGLADRLRRRRAYRLSPADPPSLEPAPSDPRIAIAAAAVLVFWATVYSIPLPLFGWSVPSLWTLVGAFVPGMDAVRSGLSLRAGVYLTAALLAGYGIVALGQGRSSRRRGFIAALVAVLWFVEVEVQALATRAYGQRTDFIARAVRPPEETIDLFRRIDAGAVLDLPLRAIGIAASLAQASDYVLLHSYHRQPVAVCNNSFNTAVQLHVYSMADLLLERGWNLDALYGAGFRYVVVHEDRLTPEQRERYPTWRQRLSRELAGHVFLEPVGSDQHRSVYRIAGSIALEPSLSSLDFGGDEAESVEPGTTYLPLVVRNHGEAVWVQPPPLRPTPLVIRWYSTDQRMLRQDEARVLLPLALGAKERLKLAIKLPDAAPPDADEVRISFASRADDVIARFTVRSEPHARLSAAQ